MYPFLCNKTSRHWVSYHFYTRYCSQVQGSKLLFGHSEPADMRQAYYLETSVKSNRMRQRHILGEGRPRLSLLQYTSLSNNVHMALLRLTVIKQSLHLDY